MATAGDFAAQGLDPMPTGENIQTDQGTIIADKDNATSFRLRGASSPNDPSAGASVQSYAGIFHNVAYTTWGTLETRASYGANLEMDLILQSPHALILSAVDDTQSDGVLVVATKTNVVFNIRADAEVNSPHQLIFDRVATGSTGTSNTSDINVYSTAGKIYFQNGVTVGGIVLPLLTTVEIGALTPVAGECVYDTTTNKAQVWDGSVWQDLF